MFFLNKTTFFTLLFSSTFLAAEGQRALVVGASSGMGYEIAKILIQNGYTVAVTARRTDRLTTLTALNPEKVISAKMDISQIEESLTTIDSLITQLGGLDLCILAATGYREMDWLSQDWKSYSHFLKTDIISFTAISKTIINFFEKQKHGHFLGFSSVSGYRAEGHNSIYSAAKSYATRFLEGERNRLAQKQVNVQVTELVPGWVITSENDEIKPHMYWIDTQEEAGLAIWRAIVERRAIGYVTERQEKVVKLLPLISEDLYNALNARPNGMI
jgi:short-subunit dehydrogenase